MNASDLYVALYAPIVLLGLWQYCRDKQRHRLSVRSELALESAKLLREWCTWLATLSTASIGASAYVSAGLIPKPAFPLLAHLATISFMSSIACTATLLLSLPSLVSRINQTEDPSNDIYEAAAFLWAPTVLKPIFRVGYLAFAQYYFFLAGVVGFVFNATHTK
ncbi:hypothetical protein [Piscinibacter gummiphilus]|uniref:Uncharacterized protein n=1 Tax=Piscinibacter gummiphilus TaxID=946333 RepID=A0ABZ0CPW8_9BURK|nr:hypothetical protein [Piscinibacter gummiphilus]WOB06878.1 hypothetical protein RXV79_18370 [Piscinibacter gummiphilus]